MVLKLKSPILWRVGAVVFASILLIEAVLLMTSWFSERNRIIARINDSVHTLSLSLAEGNPASSLDQLINTRHNAGDYPVVGYIFSVDDQIVARNGNTVGLRTVNSIGSLETLNKQTGHYDSLVRLDGQRDPTRRNLRLRIDASHLSVHLDNYVLRILGLVVLISLFVTFVSLAFLAPTIIKPLQKLNRIMIDGQEVGIRNIEPNQQEARRNDELGSVFRSFDQLRRDLIKSEDERLRSSSRFEEFANMGADCFWELDRNLRLRYLAGDIERVFHTSKQQLLGKRIRSTLCRSNGYVSDFNDIVRDLKATGSWEGQICYSEKTAKPLSVRILGNILMDEQGQFQGARGTVKDITEARELAEELSHQASHDELTGLFNRRELTRILTREAERFHASGRTCAMAVLDLDGFKYINDACGHNAGDILLKTISGVLISCVGEADLVARQGGDEFALVFPGRTAKEAQPTLQGILDVIQSKQFMWEDEFYSITASIGVAEFSEQISTQEGLVYAADSCCINAKRSGKNQVLLNDTNSGQSDNKESDAFWIKRVTHAINENTLTLFKQDIVQISDDRPEAHFEILLRMQDDEGGYFPPYKFLPVAERFGLMSQVDRWVVEHATDWLRQQVIPPDADLCMNINLSVSSLSDQGFRDFLLDQVRALGVLASYVCFEVTESAVMTNLEKTIEFLDQIRSMGCLIALDDFGTGFSSLSQIRTLPLDYIKIDGVFIKDICDNELDRTLVESVSNLAKVLDIKTVAEFVDCDRTLAVLNTLNVDYAQGYLFSRPEPLAAFLDESFYECRQAA